MAIYCFDDISQIYLKDSTNSLNEGRTKLNVYWHLKEDSLEDFEELLKLGIELKFNAYASRQIYNPEEYDENVLLEEIDNMHDTEIEFADPDDVEIEELDSDDNPETYSETRELIKAVIRASSSYTMTFNFV